MTTPFDYAAQHGDRFIQELIELLKIPSISTFSTHKAEVRRAAEWCRAGLLAAGVSRAEVMETEGHPIVYGEWLGAGPDKPTVLVYGHYDVQPADDPHKEWRSDPFDPVTKDGNIYARGATDDKGQMYIHFKTFEAVYKTTGAFPVNVKFMLEGEEESGSPSLETFIAAHRDLLKCDVVIISDTEVLGPDTPSIAYGLRGLVYTEVEIFGPKIDLHSGSYGGAVHNPAQVLVEMLAGLHDAEGHVTIPGFYDDVVALTPADRQAFAEVPRNAETFYNETGVPKDWGEPEFTIYERIGARPTLEINGLNAGWTGEGAKTVIGKTALAKVSFRLAPNQDPERIFKLWVAHVAKITPPTVRSEVRVIGHWGHAVLTPLDSTAMQAASGAYEKTFGRRPYFLRGGGSIPVVALYQQLLNASTVMMGFGLPDDNLHAPNEKMNIGMFHKGVRTMIHFFQDLPAAMAKA